MRCGICNGNFPQQLEPSEIFGVCNHCLREAKLETLENGTMIKVKNSIHYSPILEDVKFRLAIGLLFFGLFLDLRLKTRP